MRKVYSLLFAAVATLAAVSCNKEVAPSEDLVEDAVVFTAGFDEQTRTTINQEGKSLWEKSDKITIHNGTKGYEFTADKAGRNVSFTYTGNDFAGEKFMAVYPEEKINVKDDDIPRVYTFDLAAKTVTANIPSWQEARKNTWSKDAAVAVAYSEDDMLEFKNATAMIKFTVVGEKVKNIYFKGNNGEVVSGNVLVTLNPDNSVKSVVGTDTEVTKKSNPQVAEIYGESSNKYYFRDNATYYLAVIPQNFTAGFTISVAIDDGSDVKEVKKLTTSYNLKPNTVLNVGTIHGVEQSWAVAGTFNSWDTSANPMTKEGAYYVLKGVTGLNYTAATGEEPGSATGFKFVVNGTDWKGSVGEVAAGAWEYVWDAGNGLNIYVKDATAEAAYDIYVNANPSKGDNGKFVVVPAGTPMPEDPDEALQWGIVGNVNGWGASSDILMYNTATAGLFVAKNVQMPAGGFKIRANNEWNDAANYGLETAGAVEVDHVYDLICGAGSNNMTLTAGTYDIWFDLTNSKVYIMSPGKDISEAVAGSVQTPPAPTDDTWYLVGSFNGWNTKDDAYKMVVEGDWFVCKNLTLAANAEVKVCNGSWDVNRGGSFAGVGTACSVTQDGSNIKITTAGTYDVYLNGAADKLYFMAAGETPAN